MGDGQRPTEGDSHLRYISIPNIHNIGIAEVTMLTVLLRNVILLIRELFVGWSTGCVRRQACGLPYPGLVSDRIPLSRSHPAFRRPPRCQRPGRCQPLYAAICPRRRPIVQLCPMGEGTAIPRPTIRGPIGRCASLVGVALPVALSPSHFAPFRACHHLWYWSIDGVPSSARNSIRDQPVIAPPLHPCCRSNSYHASKRYVLGQNRESGLWIEIWKLQFSTRECNFPGINIPSHNGTIKDILFQQFLCNSKCAL